MSDRESVFLTAQWRDLAMLNWEIEPWALGPFLPAGTEVDTFEGRTFVSLVAFRFLDTRVLGVSVPFHRDFEEVNLRIYVRYCASDGWRRGVVFVREVVPRLAIATIANLAYHENYVALPTASEITPDRVTYRWRASAGWNEIRLDPTGEPELPGADSVESFIAEHYFGYAKRADGGTNEYRVGHPPWRVRAATDVVVSSGVPGFYDPPFTEILSRPPDSAFLAEGSGVTVDQPRRVLV